MVERERQKVKGNKFETDVMFNILSKKEHAEKIPSGEQKK